MQSDEATGATTRAPSQVVEDALTLSAKGQKRSVMARYVFGNKTNPASVGSGDCSGRDEAGLRTFL
jgi:hypothetical protein